MPNTNYILTSSGSFVSEDELYHHGVKGMKWGVRKRNAYNLAVNNKYGRKVRSEYTSIRNASKQSAQKSLQRYNGNVKKAMVSTAAKSFGKAAAVNMGGRAVSALLRIGAAGATATGHAGIAFVGDVAAHAVRRGTRTSSMIMAGCGAMKLSDIYKQGKNSK